MTRLRFLVGGLLLIAVASCRDPASGAGTALYVTITYDGTVTQLPTQFSFSAQDTTASRTVFSGYLDPSPPAAAGITGPATVLLELSNHPEAVGDAVVVHVDGLVGANVVGSGNSQPVTVKKGLTVQVAVTIGVSGAGDAGHDGGADGGTDGGGDAGPGCSGCTTCCSVGTCLPAASVGFHACGADGGQCFACSAQSADGCNTDSGTCSCGGGPACTQTTDTCLGAAGCVCGDAGSACRPNELCQNGSCHCGSGPTCGSGTACDSLGQCICSGDAGCTTGCCVRGVGGGNDTCGNGTTNTSCGKGGVDCQDCTAGGGTCSAQQVCTSCNAGNCSTGCCLNGGCKTTGFPACGDGGETCTSCNPTTANDCGAAGCQCGKNPACAPGLVCTDAGTCVCNASCPGCCQGNVCYVASPDFCGTNGSACLSCAPRGDTCTGGGCTCDGGTICPSDQVCSNGKCTCIPSKCTGCCNGDHCVSGTALTACGVTNSYCVDCSNGVGPNSGNYCCGGVCQCGTLGCGGLGTKACSGSQTCTCTLGCSCN
jgi:hypothetical protein